MALVSVMKEPPIVLLSRYKHMTSACTLGFIGKFPLLEFKISFLTVMNRSDILSTMYAYPSCRVNQKRHA